MYRCENCGHLFEEGEEARWVEKHGLDTPPYEEWSGCPLCKGAYEKISPCKICGSYNHDYDEDYCDQCKKDVKRRFETFIEKEFTKEERKLLNELYECKPI